MSIELLGVEDDTCNYKKQSLGDKHVFDTPQSIGDINQFRKLLEVCQEAQQGELIVLNVFCYGGDCDVTAIVYKALRETQATVFTINQQKACSGGSMLLLAGDQIGYTPFCTTMVHTSSLGLDIDKLPEVKGHVDDHNRFLEDFYKEIYTGFLSEEELKDVLKGTPLYVYDEEHQERLKNLFKYRESQQEEYMKELPSKEDLLKKTKKELIAMMVGEDE